MFSNIAKCPTCGRGLLELYTIYDNEIGTINNEPIDKILDENNKLITNKKIIDFIEKYKIKDCCVSIIITRNNYCKEMSRKI